MFKKIIIYVLLSVSLSMLLFFLLKKSVIDNLEEKQTKVNEYWNNIVTYQNKKISLLSPMLELDIKEKNSISDSLKVYFSRYKKLNTKKCDSLIIDNQYYINVFCMRFMKLNNFKNENLINDEIDQLLNKNIEEYNLKVRDFNSYSSTIPYLFIARSNGYKNKIYFNIKYGIDNISRKDQYKESREWQKKIELENDIQ
ncbi:MAG: hypothetical protein QM528_09160 [Phycisphaerales bacterium]|nr:hypothetical protein [Phycisphaerales bacterium]